ncbi:NAD(P)H-binding protein [Paenibacillus sp. SAF-054]|uniref:NAD(P)H-binding protein n=1 Tax=unclassified Paenibacillus TaxID=185978 RepID=UPI003F800D1D
MQPEKPQRRPVIAVTGATGYIGHNLLQRLIPHADIIALSRHGDRYENTDRIQWRSCDFFSFEDAEKGLRGADYAVYLIHSMLPSAKLTQGRFEDMDVILAEHFARAAYRNGIKQIVYLSGIIPPDTRKDDLSRHLRSRLEVEQVLGSYGVPVTTLRAGLIVGPEGSSFPILAKLVRRLPVMILPTWTRTKTHPIALPDVLEAFVRSIGNREVYSQAIDIGGPDVMSYKDMIQQTAAMLGKRRRFFPVPLLTIKLSRLWVTLITGAPKEMAYPLIESLAHPMVAQSRHLVEGISYGSIAYEAAARAALEEERQKKLEEKRGRSNRSRHPLRSLRRSLKSDVRSVQRICLPEGKDADWLAAYYLAWLSRFAKPLIRTETGADEITRIYILLSRKPLLELAFVRSRSRTDHAIYRIAGGSFANVRDAHRGRLEFLQIPGTRECIVAIHDYMPSLPWFVYKYSQAKVHLAVMHLFNRHLLRLIRRNKLKDAKRHKHAATVKRP